MRFLALCLCLVACSSDPAPASSPDASQQVDALLVDAAPDVATPDAPADSPEDVAPDRAQVDADADAADVPARDVAPEADPCGAPNLRTCDVNGHNECVDVSAGRVLGGVVVHCGACGVTCAVGEICAERRCQRL